MSWAICQRNLPSDSLKAIRIALGPSALLSRGFLLLVLTKTLPSAMIGPPLVSWPRSATHLTCLGMSLSLSEKVTGVLVSVVLTMLRALVPPNIGHGDCGSALPTGGSDFAPTKTSSASGALISGVNSTRVQPPRVTSNEKRHPAVLSQIGRASCRERV